MMKRRYIFDVLVYKLSPDPRDLGFASSDIQLIDLDAEVLCANDPQDFSPTNSNLRRREQVQLTQ